MDKRITTLQYAPTRRQRERFRATLVGSKGRTVTIDRDPYLTVDQMHEEVARLLAAQFGYSHIVLADVHERGKLFRMLTLNELISRASVYDTKPE